ncbi:MAG: hypothetical protein N3A54_06710 [Patescibacteria group bacterium]|nr:hypothetical protein [Patescibacteria group bacterium]
MKESILVLTDIKDQINKVRRQVQEGEETSWPSMTLPDGKGGWFNVYFFHYDNHAVYATFSITQETSTHWIEEARKARKKNKRMFLRITAAENDGYVFSPYLLTIDTRGVFSSFPDQIKE